MISGQTYNTGHKDVVQLLLDRGANTTLKLSRNVCCGEAGKTACYWNYKVDYIIPGCDGCSGPGNYSSNPIGDIRSCCTLASYRGELTVADVQFRQQTPQLCG